MLSAVSNEEWSMHSYPFSSFGDMESEIAELRTLTKVTKLRQQIECKQEGAWMVVRNVPDDNSRSGTRKVTSYGRSSRSVTRSVSQNVSGGSVLNNNNNYSSNVVIEHPFDDHIEESPKKNNSSVEITEVFDEPSQTDEVIPLPSKIPVKKTSVVTLGKGNIVLMDDEDSNFQVTGISKGRVADAVSTLERVAQGSEKKVKKVGFCKTEVHFAPDSGRVNIVETDEKPPPTQINRKKKRPRIKNKSDLPKLYFGNTSTDISAQNNSLLTDDKDIFTAIKEPITSSTYSTTSHITDTKNENLDTYGYIRKVSPSSAVSKKPEEKSTFSYLGNVSPRLSKLLQNNMQHEFQAKQKQILKNLESVEADKEVGHQVNLSIPCETGLDGPLKVVTQVSLGDGRGEVEHKFVVKTNISKTSEPIYINKEMTVEIKNNSVSHRRSLCSPKEKVPKPRPRTTVVLSPQVKDVRSTKTIKQPEKTKKVSPRPKEAMKKDNIPIKLVPTKPCSRSPSVKLEKRSVKGETNSCASVRSQKLVKSCSVQEKSPTESRVRKAKEPLRSFEKVSNGWVGHCITPVRTDHAKGTQVSITSKLISEKTAVHSSQSQGSKRSNVTGSVKSSRSNESKASNRSTLTDNKQFSLSKEHLRSAKLVKELANREKHTGYAESRLSKKTFTTVSNNSSREVTQLLPSSKPQPKIGVVKPRIVQHSHSANKSNSVSVRISLPRTEHSAIRSRRDSDQSDDSVVRADEEVRAYMFNTRHKVL